MQNITMHLVGFAMKGDIERFLSDATLYMEYFGNLIMGWQWLMQAVVAQRHLLAGSGSENEEFYRAKIHTMKYFFHYEMPKTLGLAHRLMDDEVLTIDPAAELVQ